MIKQNILFKIRNHLPAVLPNQIYHTYRGTEVKILSGEYWHLKATKKHREKKREKF